MDKNEKAELGAKTIGDFLKQFGSDKHAELVLECLFKELFSAEIISLLSQSEQKRNQTDNISQ